jgi:glycosyltransferase involved in cell wall biosynthesis
MKIIINIKILLHDMKGNNPCFPFDIVDELINKNPEHEFAIITDGINSKRFSAKKNVSVIIVSNSTRHPLLWKWWHDIKLPGILKKYKANVFVSFNGFCSLTASVPQCILLHDLSFLYKTSLPKRSHLFFYKRYLPKFLQKANTIISSSFFLKKEITAQHNIASEKIDVIHAAAGEMFHPLSEKEKEEIRIKYSNSKNYFVSVAAPHADKSLIILLKAFSVFKKMQKSNWKLVLISVEYSANKKIAEILKTYKYRTDVVLTGELTHEEFVMLIGSAYALIDPLPWNGIDTTTLNAMKCHIPVITSNDPAGKEQCEEAALYADPNDYKDIADKLMLLYKDEALHSSLVEKSKIVSGRNSLANQADLLWQSIITSYNTVSESLP